MTSNELLEELLTEVEDMKSTLLNALDELNTAEIVETLSDFEFNIAKASIYIEEVRSLIQTVKKRITKAEKQ